MIGPIKQVKDMIPKITRRPSYPQPLPPNIMRDMVPYDGGQSMPWGSPWVNPIPKMPKPYGDNNNLPKMPDPYGDNNVYIQPYPGPQTPVLDYLNNYRNSNALKNQPRPINGGLGGGKLKEQPGSVVRQPASQVGEMQAIMDLLKRLGV